jgi:hypothetical protein
VVIVHPFHEKKFLERWSWYVSADSTVLFESVLRALGIAALLTPQSHLTSPSTLPPLPATASTSSHKQKSYPVPKNQKLTPGFTITLIGKGTLETVQTVLTHPEERVAGKKCPILPSRVFSSRTTYRVFCAIVGGEFNRKNI